MQSAIATVHARVYAYFRIRVDPSQKEGLETFFGASTSKRKGGGARNRPRAEIWSLNAAWRTEQGRKGGRVAQPRRCAQIPVSSAPRGGSEQDRKELTDALEAQSRRSTGAVRMSRHSGEGVSQSQARERVVALRGEA